MWQHTGQTRPPFAVTPRAGQESVWDYPRPPRMAGDAREVIVRSGEVELARTTRALRVLETASPPTFYLPPDDVRGDLLVAAPGASMCEWKGVASYWALRDGSDEAVAWSYAAPLTGFEALRGWFGFYPGRVACFVDGERVAAQPGRFYAGWVTREVVGPFKGEVGSGAW